MHHLRLNFLILCFLTVVFSSCRVFNPNRMFKAKYSTHVDSIQKQIAQAEKNYTIQKNDYLTIQVFTNNGERIVDPDFELSRQGGIIQRSFDPPKYLVRDDGFAKLPLIGNMYVVGFTFYQLDSILSIGYSKYYESPFVVSKLLNKRVIVMGPLGGKVIPLENENVNLIEIIALYGGINQTGKSYNIKLIRGDLKNPDVSVIDLSTIAGMKAANLSIEPNDIVYIETQRKIISESIAEISPIISIISTVLFTIILLSNSK